MEGTKFVTIKNWRQNSWIISLKVKHLMNNGLVYSRNKLYSHKKGKSLLITNINHNLGNKVSEWNFSEPKYNFSQDKIH